MSQRKPLIFNPSSQFRQARGALPAGAESRGKTRPSPFSLRLTPDERTRLEREAADMPLGTYIKCRLFDKPPNWKPRRSSPGVSDPKSLAQALALLGQSRLASNLNQLAKAANIGSLPVTPDTEAALNDACSDVKAMKSLLLTALGLKPGEGA